MTLSDPDFGLSFELFPPRSLGQSFKLWSALETLSGLAPKFVSVTYGAGGSTRDISRSAVEVIAQQYEFDVAGHLTCVGASREEVLGVAKDYADLGANQIVALRGDGTDGTFFPHPDGFSSSIELIEALAEMDRFHIRVAAYPDVHPDARSAAQDLTMLHSKFAAGADSAITQFFFEADDFLRFRDQCARVGIHGKITPGILPIENWARTRKFAERCGAKLPAWLIKAFDHCKTKEDHDILSVALCTELCDDLIREGVEDLHFYTLNDARLSLSTCRALGRNFTRPSVAKVA